MTCAICNDTGKLPGSDYLDCGCQAASDRAELDAWSAELPIYQEPADYRWAIHQRARQIERQEQAARIAELERALRSAHHLLANVEGMSKNNIENMAGEEADAIAAVLAAAPSAPAVEQPIGHISKGMLEQLRERLGVSGYVQSGRTEEFPVALYATPQAADTDNVRLVLGNKLYNDIINIRCEAHQSAKESVNGEFFYKVGHRDARHAAAELVASMAAQAPVREVPEGWQLVPKEPTQLMFDAARTSASGSSSEKLLMKSYWRNMLAAAPLPAAPVQQEGGK